MRLSSVVWLRQEEGSWLTLALVSGLVHLAQPGLGRSGLRQLMYRGPLGLLTNRCLETPGVITPTVSFLLFTTFIAHKLSF